mmetsp:Transcript_11628/g.26290  ORF Transcript_11628/g.26290 Transcript_11628/m.26290 type:complete len:206 (+) Transcript_11628:1128-1745(+)
MPSSPQPLYASTWAVWPHTCTSPPPAHRLPIHGARTCEWHGHTAARKRTATLEHHKGRIFGRPRSSHLQSTEPHQRQEHDTSLHERSLYCCTRQALPGRQRQTVGLPVQRQSSSIQASRCTHSDDLSSPLPSSARKPQRAQLQRTWARNPREMSTPWSWNYSFHHGSCQRRCTHCSRHADVLRASRLAFSNRTLSEPPRAAPPCE